MSKQSAKREPREPKKKEMLLFYDKIELFMFGEEESLSDAEVGQLFKALFFYDLYGEDNPPKDRYLKKVYRVLQAQLDINLERYREKSRKATESVNQRWHPSTDEDLEERIKEARKLNAEEKKKNPENKKSKK